MILAGPKKAKAKPLGAGGVKMNYPLVDPRTRWKTFLIALLATGVLLVAIIGPEVGLFILLPLTYGLAVILLNCAEVKVTPDRIRWRILPLPGKTGGNFKRPDIEGVIWGPIGKLKKGRWVLYAVGLRLKRSSMSDPISVPIIFDSMPTHSAAQSVAEQIAAALGGVEPEYGPMGSAPLMAPWAARWIGLLAISMLAGSILWRNLASR